MNERMIKRINVCSFLTALTTIVLGVVVSLLGVWELVYRTDLLWRMLASDAIVFAGAVLTNLAIACYRKPGGELA